MSHQHQGGSGKKGFVRYSQARKTKDQKRQSHLISESKAAGIKRAREAAEREAAKSQ